MATWEVGTRNAIVDAVTAQIDASGPGTIVFETSGDVEVATCTFSADSFPAAASGTASANTITDDSDAAGGEIAQVSIYNGVPTKIVECTIDTDSLSEFQISSLTIGEDDVVSVSDMDLTAAAS
jgi:hypothetical protein